MHDLAFCDSARQTPVKILRMPMRPYSIGHEILLANQRNQLLFEGQNDPDIIRAALIQAALICRRTWKQNQNPKEWGMKILFWLWRNTDWDAEVEIFRVYRSAGATSPPQPSKENYEIANGAQSGESGREFGSSSMARLLHFLADGRLFESLGYESPYDVPFGFASHLHLSCLEMDGKAVVENTREAQVKLEMEGHLRAIAEEKAKGAK